MNFVAVPKIKMKNQKPKKKKKKKNQNTYLKDVRNRPCQNASCLFAMSLPSLNSSEHGYTTQTI